MTSLDKLASLPRARRHLRKPITLAHLRALACALTDLDAGRELNQARAALFEQLAHAA